MAVKTEEEKIAELNQKIDQLKARKRAIQNRAKAEERKKRTHRLIQVGAIVESIYGEITDLKAFEEFVRSRKEQ